MAHSKMNAGSLGIEYRMLPNKTNERKKLIRTHGHPGAGGTIIVSLEIQTKK